MITLILVGLGLSTASAQTNGPVAQCDSFVLEKTASQNINITRGYGSRPQVKTQVAAVDLGKQLLNGGIDVQTIEPMDAVYIARKASSPDTFEVVYKDHRVTETESVPVYMRYDCNEAANQLLKELIATATN